MLTKTESPQNFKRLINKEKEKKEVIQIIDEDGFLREVSFDDLTSHPTTISGYGITDAYIDNGTIYLGNNSITPAQSGDLSNYLPLSAGSGKALTGDLYFNASSANKAIRWTYDGSGTAKALNMQTDGTLSLGADQITNGKITYIYGAELYYSWGTTAATNQVRFVTNTFRPGANNSIYLGNSSYKWKGVYATEFFGSLALSNVTGADDLKAIEALTGTSGFLKKTAANTWALDTAPDASTLNGKTAAEILSGVESLKTTSENDAMFTYRKTPSVAVGDMAKLLKIKGNTLVWNQLVKLTSATTTDASCTLTPNADGKSFTITGTSSGIGVLYFLRNTGGSPSITLIKNHKYLQLSNVVYNDNTVSYIIWGNWALSGNSDNRIYTYTGEGATITSAYVSPRSSGKIFASKNFYINLIDLTATFGEGYEPTVAEFQALYPELFYSYNTGSLQSNRVAAIETTGWNQWDEEWKGGYKLINGEESASINDFCSKNYTEILPSTDYYFYNNMPSGTMYPCWYDAGKNYISSSTYISVGQAGVRTSPANARYMRFWVYSRNAYAGEININLSNPSRNGEYQPYHKDTLQLNVTDLVPVDKPTVRLNQLVSTMSQTLTSAGVTAVYTTDGKITLSNTATGASSFGIPGINSFNQFVIGHKYFIKGCPAGGSNATYSIRYNNNGYGQIGFPIIVTAASSGGEGLLTRVPYINIANGTNVNGKVFIPQVIDLTEMYGAGNEPTSTAEVEALIGTDYIPTNAGEDIPNRIFPQGERGAGTAFDLAYGNTAEKRMGVVDLGTLSWTRGTDLEPKYFYATIANKKSGNNMLCAIYTTRNVTGLVGNSLDKIISGSASSGNIYITNSNYTTAADFKAAMNGVLLIYELNTPVTYTIAPLPQLIASDPDGTQRRLPVDTASSVSAPMVCDIQYGANPSDIYEEDERKIQETNQSIADTNNAIAEILTQLPSSGKVEIPTDDPVNPDNTKTYIYYDDLTHKICVREKDGTVYSVQLSV